MISVLIMTKNEEQDLPSCLDSLNWCDDVHVFDSFSNDKTVDIARKADVNVVQREFDGYASQRNAALSTIRFKHDWIFFLDADERIPSELVKEISQTLENISPAITAFSIRRRDYLNGVWLKHAQITPYYIRCFRPEKVKYHREINEVIKVEGETLTLNGHFKHYPFSKGIRHWLNKHNGYSTMEAQRWIEENKTNMKFSLKKAFLGSSLSERRFHQKGLFYKIPGRPVIKWFYIVIARRAFLDGKPGIMYATLQSIYEYFIVLKTREMLAEQKLKG